MNRILDPARARSHPKYLEVMVTNHKDPLKQSQILQVYQGLSVAT